MKLTTTVLFAVLMLFGMRASADMMLKDKAGNTVTLHNGTCAASPWMEKWKTATMVYNGVQYEACWRIQSDTVVVLDSGGDVTPLPMGAFYPVTGT